MSIALAVVRAVLDRARGRRRLAVEARDGRALGAARRQRRAALLPLGQVLRARPDAAARPAHPVRRALPSRRRRVPCVYSHVLYSLL